MRAPPAGRTRRALREQARGKPATTVQPSASCDGVQMAIALTEEHRELASMVRSFLRSGKARAASRALLESEQEALPEFWTGLAELGLLGLHVPEEYGGGGYGLPELAVVVEELG